MMMMILISSRALLLLWLIALSTLCNFQDVASYTIAIVPKSTSYHDFFGLVQEGCMDRVELELNRTVTCYYTGTLHGDVEGSLAILNDLVDDPSIDAIAVSVIDPVAYGPVINRGVALGKPIVTFDSDAPDSDRYAYIGTDNFAMGQELAKLLKQIKPDGGRYGILSGMGLNLEQRVAGVRNGLQQAEDSMWVEADYSANLSIQQMWQMVEQNPDLGAIISVSGWPMIDDNTTAWKHFVDSNRNVLTVFADTTQVQMELMQTSYVDALVGQLPYNMGHQSADTLLKALDAKERGVNLTKLLPSDIILGTHQLEVLRIPLELPPVDFQYNHIGGQIAVVGYMLCAIVVVSSIGCMVWTLCHQQHQVVKSGQPVFLIMICMGTFLMGSAIIPLSIDDELGQEAANIACMTVPWLINIGLTVTFSALFSKTWRLNKIFLSRNSLQRITVTEKDVMLPFVVLLSINIITLICWTVIAPLEFVRTNHEGTDPWNRPIGSYGQCLTNNGARGGSVPYAVVLGAVNLTTLIVANVQAYRARNVRTDFNESSYIAMANASFLQAFVVCLPILFLTRENPPAYYLVLSVILFIVSGAVLVFIFVPKMIALKEAHKSKASGQRRRFSIIQISGLEEPNSGTRSASLTNTSCLNNRRRSTDRSSCDGSGNNPVDEILLRYQALSQSDKIEVQKQISPAKRGLSSPVSSTIGNLSSLEENAPPVTPDEESNSTCDTSAIPEAPAEALEASDKTQKVADNHDVESAISSGPCSEENPHTASF